MSTHTVCFKKNINTSRLKKVSYQELCSTLISCQLHLVIHMANNAFFLLFFTLKRAGDGLGIQTDIFLFCAYISGFEPLPCKL